MSDNHSVRVHDAASRGILGYLLRHPDAKDTIEGIIKWWLADAVAECDQAEVQEALDGLTARGWLTKRDTTRSQTVYGMNKDQLQEVREFLNEFT